MPTAKAIQIYNDLRREGKGGQNQKLSAKGKNKPCTGFASRAKLKKHMKKHGVEFEFTSPEEYEKAGITLLQQPVGGFIDGYLREKDGAIIRFNTETAEFAVGYPGAELLSYYKAGFDKDTGKINLVQANGYFNSKKKREIYEEDSETRFA